MRTSVAARRVTKPGTVKPKRLTPRPTLGSETSGLTLSSMSSFPTTVGTKMTDAPNCLKTIEVLRAYVVIGRGKAVGHGRRQYEWEDCSGRRKRIAAGAR